ncbi:hypothetical protein [Sulfitobacter sp. SK011]|uniref:hypothetical protein n=1 Tax=Sulfitobacter sp. SK011 TaxID=1389004 RepID=UPI000E0AEC68|nr:hypothetical protein [Sulfitobacter sp. SK011]AXI43899.1 hypothetical protein C1J02_19725 [Sulfitobacter sp. SK011]
MLKYLVATLAILTTPALADAPVVSNVNVSKAGDVWKFDVTLSHKDTGWDDYANAWRILDNSGKELGVRNLAHPHVNEQPFTRSLSGIRIPADVTEVGIQASDTIGGWSSPIKKIKLR